MLIGRTIGGFLVVTILGLTMPNIYEIHEPHTEIPEYPTGALVGINLIEAGATGTTTLSFPITF